MAWLRSDGSAARSARLMIGVAPGDRVLVGGASHASLAADLALVTGLNGRTVVLDRDPTARDRVEAAAAAAGALVEFTTGVEVSGSGPAPAFDLVVLGEDATRDRELVVNATRALRPAGRAIVRLDLQRKGLLGWRTKRADGTAAIDAGIAALTDVGLARARLLGEIDGIAFVEAVRSR